MNKQIIRLILAIISFSVFFISYGIVSFINFDAISFFIGTIFGISGMFGYILLDVYVDTRKKLKENDN